MQGNPLNVPVCKVIKADF
uniref:Uncharacterized protein n=1 Tax=Anguilla anguilla TaxID=7936 RepID=A0A0E9TCM2_ANGAN